MLLEADRRRVAVATALDTAWKPYEPTWPNSFDVTDVAADSAALATLQGVKNLTLTQRKAVLKAATKILCGLVRLDDDTKDRIDKEIDALTEESFSFPRADWEDGGDDDEEDGEQPSQR
jgi:hypothetical protein